MGAIKDGAFPCLSLLLKRGKEYPSVLLPDTCFYALFPPSLHKSWNHILHPTISPSFSSQDFLLSEPFDLFIWSFRISLTALSSFPGWCVKLRRRKRGRGVYRLNSGKDDPKGSWRWEYDWRQWTVIRPWNVFLSHQRIQLRMKGSTCASSLRLASFSLVKWIKERLGGEGDKL